MNITVASFKGGVGKSVTTVHLAAVCQQKGDTLVIDGDPNASVTAWRNRGPGLPFNVLDPAEGSKKVKQYQHVIVDTAARTDKDDLAALVDSCDLLVIPSTPDILAVDALLQTLELLEALKSKYRILLTAVPPLPSKAGAELHSDLRKAGWPVFKTYIPRLAAFPRAALLGKLVKDVPDPRAQIGWEAYESVGKEVLSELKRSRESA